MSPSFLGDINTMKYMQQGLLFLLVGLGTAPFLVSCDQAPPQPDGQVEIPSEDAQQDPNALDSPQGPSGEAPADPTVPDSAVNPPEDSPAQGGASDLPPLDSEQAAPDSAESQGAVEQPQDSELPLITEPDPSSEEAPPAP
jgi:hypothetical protein